MTVTIAGRAARLRPARMGGENLIGMSKAARSVTEARAAETRARRAAEALDQLSG